MRESKAYLNFFKKNLMLFIIFITLGSIVGYAYANTQPVTFRLTSLWEFEYSQKDIDKKVVLADQAVTNLRSANLQRTFDGSGQVLVNIYKPGPLSIKIESSSENTETLKQADQSTQDYLREKYPVKQIGMTDSSTISRTYLPVFIGAGSFLLVALLISLAKAYFRNY